MHISSMMRGQDGRRHRPATYRGHKNIIKNYCRQKILLKMNVRALLNGPWNKSNVKASKNGKTKINLQSAKSSLVLSVELSRTH